jgi:hypothetical protein
MAIDPVAVSGGAAAKMPAGADVASQSDVAGNNGANFQRIFRDLEGVIA